MTLPWSRLSAGLVGTALLIGGVLAMTPHAEGVDRLDDLQVTLVLESLPLPEAIQKLSEATGIVIKITGPGISRRTSVTLRGTRFWKALNRIISPLNYTADLSAEGELTVYLSNSGGGSNQTGGTVQQMAEDVRGTPVGSLAKDPQSQDRENLEAQDNQPPNMSLDMPSYIQPIATDVQLLPTSSADDDGITKGDLEFLLETREEVPLESLEMVPSTGDPDTATTFGELRAAQELRAAWPPGIAQPHSRIQIVPYGNMDPAHAAPRLAAPPATAGSSGEPWAGVVPPE